MVRDFFAPAHRGRISEPSSDPDVDHVPFPILSMEPSRWRVSTVPDRELEAALAFGERRRRDEGEPADNGYRGNEDVEPLTGKKGEAGAGGGRRGGRGAERAELEGKGLYGSGRIGRRGINNLGGEDAVLAHFVSCPSGVIESV